MISYYGLALAWPNGKVFGTICILDIKENHYNDLYRALMSQFREIVELGLKSIFDNYQQEKRIESGVAEIKKSEKDLKDIFDNAQSGLM